MSMLLLDPLVMDTGTADDLDHVVCVCDEDNALCGTDVSDQPWGDEDTLPLFLCVVCEAIEVCPKCGRTSDEQEES